MHSNLYLVTAPAVEPVTVADAKVQCRIDHGVEDPFLQDNLIVGARQWAEAFTGRAFITQTWELKLPYFLDVIELPRPPLVSVTSIKYLDTSNTLQPWAEANYIVTGIASEARGRIEPAYGISYPSTLLVPDAVRIIYVAGYGAAAAVPQGIKDAILYHVAESYTNRERPDYSLAERTIWPWVETRFD